MNRLITYLSILLFIASGCSDLKTGIPRTNDTIAKSKKGKMHIQSYKIHPSVLYVEQDTVEFKEAWVEKCWMYKNQYREIEKINDCQKIVISTKKALDEYAYHDKWILVIKNNESDEKRYIGEQAGVLYKSIPEAFIEQDTLLIEVQIFENRAFKQGKTVDTLYVIPEIEE